MIKIFVTYFITLFFLFSKSINAETQNKITIIGNKNIDNEIILSIIEDKITDYSDINLNESPDSYAYPGNYEINLNSNDKISSEFNDANISYITGQQTLAFSYDFKNIELDWNGEREFIATFNDQDFTGLIEAFDVTINKTNDKLIITETEDDRILLYMDIFFVFFIAFAKI